MNAIEQAAQAIRQSSYTVAFTGAGISAESGIPPFRGEKGIWNRYDPKVLELSYFYAHPEVSWQAIREIFYDFFGKAKPNAAHLALAQLEAAGYLKSIITQNIDNLHQEAGSSRIFEFHGNSHTLVCTRCHAHYRIGEISLEVLPPLCTKCGALLKPNFVFFEEGIPEQAYAGSVEASENAQVMVVVGTTGEVYPAATMVSIAKQHGAKIIEINLESSAFTHRYTDIFIGGKAGEVLPQLVKEVMGT
ncbi:SIR2 family NAD-dependent protein deacylase [Williamwhitmania taraxaci]|uniref:protein acetyllysine N-acetyltransferase n=1 Tax=Williamwhitmania taraxaci TaxID=1640674 RepID=A0A1G6H6H6_9BACT|nr:NAD-dependent deacylase [Williamwhitmania taraxaci]SDB89831.1 NAD-dependent deacetylase [Williamwhitmania taraxaci]